MSGGILLMLLLAASLLSWTWPFLGLVAGAIFYLESIGQSVTQQSVFFIAVLCLCIPTLGLLLAAFLSGSQKKLNETCFGMFACTLAGYALCKVDVFFQILTLATGQYTGQEFMLLLVSCTNRTLASAGIVAILLLSLQFICEVPLFLWRGRAGRQVYPYWQSLGPLLIFVFTSLGFDVIADFWLRNFTF